jgi:hypothetical protein
MSKQDSDSEFDDFFDEEDDPVLIEYNKKRAEEIKKQQEKMKKVQSRDKKILLQRGEINESIVNQIVSDSDYQNYVDQYINKGMELNRAIRNREQLSDYYKLLLNNLNKLSKQVQQIFPEKDYIKVCRRMFNFYDKNSPPQPMSTANICVSGFGNKTLHIYIPKDAYILMKNISMETKDPITGEMVKTFEIIIPPETPNRRPQNLLDLDEASGDNYVKYYVVDSPDAIKYFQDFVEIYKQDAKKDTEEM